MAIRSKRVDPSSEQLARSAQFTASAATTDFIDEDIIDFEASLWRPAQRVEIACASDATITFLINGYQIRYPLLEEGIRFNFPARDLSAGVGWVHEGARSVIVENSETLVLAEPIRNIVIKDLTIGSGTGVVITAS